MMKENLSEQDKSVLLDHDYDGIQEFDYPLPFWWIMTFVLTTLFGVPYIIYYNFMDGPTLKQEANIELEALNQLRTSYAVKMANFEQDTYAAVMADDGVNKGQEIFLENCSPCHLESGGGDIGPNLTDNYWLNAKGTKETIYEVILNGREDKGMPIWREDLTKEEIYAVTSYVMTLVGTNIEDAKEPQGELIE
ncbi:MAG: nitrogen fixation protein FixP [Epsilonproteobacteria bacterium]|nr:MAG: nitrogen fixation protein FixP [Campylobacterota bacterium]RLA63102.1 MAG: nitrogen fixation protein FixP [Campylobacterota bacterium]